MVKIMRYIPQSRSSQTKRFHKLCVYRFKLGVTHIFFFQYNKMNTIYTHRHTHAGLTPTPYNDSNKPVSVKSVINFGMLSNILSIN